LKGKREDKEKVRGETERLSKMTTNFSFVVGDCFDEFTLIYFLFLAKETD